MDNLLLALAAILALNLAFGVRIAISEFLSRRKDRRELGALESMWHHDPTRAAREPRRPRLAGRTVAAGAAVVILSGAAIATPAGEAVVSTVGGVVDRLTDDSTIAEPAPDLDPTPPDRAPSAREASDPSSDGSHHERNNAGERGGSSASSTVSPSARSPAEPTAVPSSAVEPTASPLPPAELLARANPLSPTEIEVAWDPLPSATSYLVECSPDCPSGSVTVDPSSGIGATTFGGLTPGTSYEFGVTAMTGTGVLHDDASATTPPAPATE